MKKQVSLCTISLSTSLQMQAMSNMKSAILPVQDSVVYTIAATGMKFPTLDLEHQPTAILMGFENGISAISKNIWMKLHATHFHKRLKS